jgi:50S ribosomal subunit-associated GTPase HflX
MDRLSPSQKRRLENHEGFLLSAATGAHLNEFLQAVEKKLTDQWIEKDIFVPYRERAQMALIHEHTEILSQGTVEGGLQMRIRTHPATLAQILHSAASVKS